VFFGHRKLSIGTVSDDIELFSKIFAYSYCLFKCNFSYRCVAFDKVSTDSASCGPAAIAEFLVRNYLLF